MKGKVNGNGSKMSGKWKSKELHENEEGAGEKPRCMENARAEREGNRTAGTKRERNTNKKSSRKGS